MKKIILLTAVFLLAYTLSAEVRIAGKEDRVEFSIRDMDKSEQKISRLVALPSLSAEINVLNCEVDILDKAGNILESRSAAGKDFVKVQQSFTLRELHGHQIEVELSKADAGQTIRLKELDFEVIARDRVELPTSVSRAFLPVYRSMIDNFDNSYLNELITVPAKMLILAHNDNNNNIHSFLQYFMEWKNAKGIETELVDVATIGASPTNAQIKNYIQNVYTNSDNPPAYLLLVGDVVGNNQDFQIPSYTIHSGTEDDVTDHPYTLLEGDDYFPEMIIGRISVDNITELQTVISKIFKYEKEPYLGSSHWFDHATLSAGNYSSSPPPPTTPVKSMMWLRDKMYDYGYTNIDEFYYWPPYYNAPGSSIAPSINDGVGIVAYRGWGDANGWHYPHFHREELDDLTNGLYIPIMTSFVCNTGDFANTVDPCFGEKWVSMGSASSPVGGVVFVGPSDLHTKTKFNNSIFSGFYAGLLDEGIHSFGAAVLRGKWELWNNFPLLRHNTEEDDAWVRFYFHVYNILGDPSLEVWTTVPQAVNCNLPTEIGLGTNYLDLDLPGMDGAVVTALKGSEVFSTEVVENGSATLYFDTQSTGALTVTVTKPNHYPFIEDINVVQQGVDVGIESVSTGGAIIAGQSHNLQISLQNYGTDLATSVSASLSSDNPDVNVVTTNANYGDIASGFSVSQDYSVEFLSTCDDNEIVEFDLAISTGDTAKFEVIVSGLVIEVVQIDINDADNTVDPMDETEITVTLQNLGSFDTTTLTAQLITLNANASVIAGNVSIDPITMNETAAVDFTVGLNDQVFIGENLQFRVDVTDANSLMTSAYFSLEAGDIDNHAPTGPDGYGYYAYDSFDGFYQNCPEYEWIEIDPQEGGSGLVQELGDDRSFTIEFPMNFQYYGQETDSITICTNGWISMQPTWETYFRNWSIPSALGPYAGITPYWDDLVGPYLPGSQTERYDMRICYFYDEANHRFIVEWNECVNREDNITPEKMQVILYDPIHYPTLTGDGIIQFNYQAASNIDASDNYATVGIENWTQTDGLLYTYANIYPASATELQSGLSIKFTTDPPLFNEAAQPNTDFSVEGESGVVPFSVQFYNDTTPMYYFNEYLWDFGDGETSTEYEPQHTYEELGTYTVTLTVTNSIGTDIMTKEDYISVIPPMAPEVDFMVESIAGFAPFEVEFINNTIPQSSENEFLWDFGDGETANVESPIHMYENPGLYTVSLAAENSSGDDEMIKENYIIVIDSDEIWPGDTNSDGIVNENDILPIGFYWREMGTQRDEITFSWQANAYPLDWDVAVAPFADCNGDGEVDIADVLAICVNWNLTHIPTTTLNPIVDLEPYETNFLELYNGLKNNGTELILKNHIAQLYDFPIVTPQFSSKLAQNYPNPFNPTTKISFSLSATGKTELMIFNVKGQLVKTLIEDELTAGEHEITWSGKDESGRKVSSGLYFYRLKSNNKTIDTKKMLLLK